MDTVGFYEEVKIMEKKDVGRIKAITTKKLSDFIRLEEGSTGKQSALKSSTVLGGSVLAQVLLSALESAEGNMTHDSRNITQHADFNLPNGEHASAL